MAVFGGVVTRVIAERVSDKNGGQSGSPAWQVADATVATFGGDLAFRPRGDSDDGLS